ncbi:hypothetical protein BVC80_8957g17 [Macleaya cordata]|uniref:Uncharacterized protein n=1 Tax=Macleaya cordata TaxID=56857 RepID=A0A200QWH1_MACCD|nr:hypothetical protein BVC80_8957g17 [Macleaya cordata]
MYSTSSHCRSAYSCIAEQAEARPLLSVLFIVVILATTLTLHLWIQAEQNEEEIVSEINPGEQIKIDIPNQVSLPLPLLQKTPEVLGTSSYLDGLSPKLPNEGKQIAEVITRGKQVVNILNSASIVASSVYINQEVPTSSSCSCGPSPNYLDKENIVKFPGNQITIDVPDPGSPFALQLCKPPRVLDTSSSSVGSSHISPDKVESTGNVAVRDQTDGEISYTDSLLCQALIEGQEASNFHIEHPSSLLSEAQQTTSGIANDEPMATSQSAEPPLPPAAVVESETQVPDLKTEFKVASWVIVISGGGIVSVLAGLPGNEKAELTHNVLFKAYTLLNYISLVSAVALFLLTFRRSNIPRLVIIAKLSMWVTLGSITYALGCATSILLPKSLAGVVLILVVPLLVVFLGIILSFSIRKT